MSIVKFVTKSLTNKLMVLFLIVSMIPIAIIGIVNYSNAKNALEEAAYSQVKIVICFHFNWWLIQ